MIEPYGRTERGQDVHRVTLRGTDIVVRILSFGGIIEAIEAPDRAGRRDNLVLGCTDLDGYAHRSPHFGAITGRFAGRIAGGRFSLDGTEHRLAVNNGPNAIHGGPGGFDKVVWSIDAHDDRHVALAYRSPDGEEGYPGTLDVSVTYSVEGDTLRIDYRATTDRPTVLNLTNHSYFNLSGEGAGAIDGHVLRIDADRFVPMDAAQIPTGVLQPVQDSPFDFRIPTPIGARLRDADPQLLMAHGYDHSFALHGGVHVHEPSSGRTLDVETDQPGVHFYSGNNLTGALAGPSRRAYRPGDAFCLETQHFPDSPNQPGFPSTVLRPGEAFASWTTFRFGIG